MLRLSLRQYELWLRPARVAVSLTHHFAKLTVSDPALTSGRKEAALFQAKAITPNGMQVRTLAKKSKGKVTLPDLARTRLWCSSAWLMSAILKE